MSYGNVYTTTVNVNGKTMFQSSYSPCCCSMSSYSSCFGYGFGGLGGFGGFGGCGGFGFGCFSPEAYLGVATGYAAGTVLAPNLPAIFKGIGQGLCWFGKNVIAPAATAVGKGVKSVFNGIGSIFRKKDKTAKTEKSAKSEETNKTDKAETRAEAESETKEKTKKETSTKTNTKANSSEIKIAKANEEAAKV